MKLYQVYNGFMGFGPIFVIVIAKNKKDAERLARDKFKEGGPSAGKLYWNNLKVELLTDRVNSEYVSEESE